jgi:nucleotide-binding universal stress UspA family protein
MILRAGRPVLFVPDAIDLLQGRRIVVCWKNTREARRAVADALPFLREADHVTIASVSEVGTEEQIRSEIEDVTTYLLSHKVAVSARAYLHTEQSIAAELLRFSEEQKADLIVAGGYGHSRFGEWVFGGVTNGLLADSAVPCLFSH